MPIPVIKCKVTEKIKIKKKRRKKSKSYSKYNQMKKKGASFQKIIKKKNEEREHQSRLGFDE
jgi:hypothetical protein